MQAPAASKQVRFARLSLLPSYVFQVRWSLFTQAVQVVLSQWTVLSLAVDQGWGGPDSRQKAVEMGSAIVSEFSDVFNGKGVHRLLGLSL
jgi:hypothetical protein